MKSNIIAAKKHWYCAERQYLKHTLFLHRQQDIESRNYIVHVDNKAMSDFHLTENNKKSITSVFLYESDD